MLDFEQIDTPDGVIVGPEHFNHMFLLHAKGIEDLGDESDQIELLVEVDRIRDGSSKSKVIRNHLNFLRHVLEHRCFTQDMVHQSPQTLGSKTYEVWDLVGFWSGGQLCTRVFSTQVGNHVIFCEWVYSHSYENEIISLLMRQSIHIAS